MAAKSHRALKITSIVIGAIVAVALIAVVALNIYMRVAFAPFFDRAESPFDIPGINTGFVPQDLDHVEADGLVAVQRVYGRHSPRRFTAAAADGTIAKFYVARPTARPTTATARPSPPTSSTPIWPARRATSSSPWIACCSPKTAPACKPPRKWASISPPPS